MKKVLFILSLLVFFTCSNNVFAAETYSVGPGDGYDFNTIQAAIDASGNGDYITVSDGVYEENLVVANKNIIISGNISDKNNVILRGKVLVKKKGVLEIKDLKINAKGKKYGVRAIGEVKLSYIILTKGKQGVIGERNSEVHIYDSTIRYAVNNGVFVKKKSELVFENSKSKNNGKSGIRSRQTTKTRIADSNFRGNRQGIYIVNDVTDNTIFRVNLIKNNIGLKYLNSEASEQDIEYTDNAHDLWTEID